MSVVSTELIVDSVTKAATPTYWKEWPRIPLEHAVSEGNDEFVKSS